jgi:hypothetical protein
MVDSFTPADDEDTDNERHKIIRAKSKDTIKTENDKQFTLVEVRDAIK